MSEFTRIPVSLKLDTTTDFYNDFFVPLREDRDLSDFILGIMKAYYENKPVQDAVNAVLELNSPYAEIRRQIERINMEHGKTMMTTAMMAQQVGSTRSHAESDEPSQSPENTDPSMVLGRIESLEKALPDISGKLDALIGLMQSGAGVSNVTPFPVSKPPVQSTAQVGSISDELAQTGTDGGQAIATPSKAASPVVDGSGNTEAKLADVIVLPTAEQPSQEITIESAPPQASAAPVIVSDDEASSEDTEVRTNRPASFGKAFNSTKKSK